MVTDFSLFDVPTLSGIKPTISDSEFLLSLQKKNPEML
jgi:hypothetical protein